jgi:hypothetical protein
MKENQRISAAIDLRVRQLNLPNLPLPGKSNNHTRILSIRVATFGRNELSASSRILLTGRYDRFCANLPYEPKPASTSAAAVISSRFSAATKSSPCSGMPSVAQ